MEYEEVIKQLKIAKEKYNQLHRCCPECGGTNNWQTLVGFVMKHGHEEDYKDLNDVHCQCGWKGLVHDMTP